MYRGSVASAANSYRLQQTDKSAGLVLAVCGYSASLRLPTVMVVGMQ